MVGITRSKVIFVGCFLGQGLQERFGKWGWQHRIPRSGISGVCVFLYIYINIYQVGDSWTKTTTKTASFQKLWKCNDWVGWRRNSSSRDPLSTNTLFRPLDPELKFDFFTVGCGNIPTYIDCYLLSFAQLTDFLVYTIW